MFVWTVDDILGVMVIGLIVVSTVVVGAMSLFRGGED